jgi:acetoin utilization protein AcuB
VLDDGQLVGVVSQRDLHLIESLQGVDPDAVSVSEAMSTDVFTVSPRTNLRKVATEMATRKLGSAVVVDDDAVVGVFTTIDALDVLVGVVETQKSAADDDAENKKAKASPRRKRKVARATS